MTKCAICRENPQEWIWQPCGPSDDAYLFTLPGSHTRGFLAIAVCDPCRVKIRRGERVTFSYKGSTYEADPTTGEINGLE